MAKLTTDELLEAFKEMTLIELSEFVKLFEDTFGVTAAAPVAAAATAPAMRSMWPTWPNSCGCASASTTGRRMRRLCSSEMGESSSMISRSIRPSTSSVTR